MYLVKVMREYILTKQEREVINLYLEKNIKAEGYRVLRHRCSNLDKAKVRSDLELIEKFLKESHDRQVIGAKQKREY